jgi:hypothetical protein
MKHKQLAVLAVIAAVCGASACGSDDDDGDNGGGGSDRGALVVETTDPNPDKVKIEAPASIEAGAIRMTLQNRGDTLHDAQLFKVDGGHDAADVVSEVLEAVDGGPKPGWMHPAGGVAPVRPGAAASTTQRLEPGTYYIADTQERPDGGRRTNGAKGGIAKLEVTGEPGSGKLPPPSAVVTATDKDGFVTRFLKAGRNRVLFRNAGEQLHQAVALPVEPGAKSLVAGARAAIQRRSGTAWVPVDVEGSRATVALDSGREQITELTLERKPYVLVCFLSDRKGSIPHAYTGMASLVDLSSGKERLGAVAP